MTDQTRDRKQRRDLISSAFIAILVAIAFDEMAGTATRSINLHGLNFNSLMLPAIFFVTSLRFFVGNHLHLISETLVDLPGRVWLFDFLIIVFQSTVLILLGGVASVDSSRVARLDFVALLLLVLVVDVIWIATQWGLGSLFRPWRRQTLPWRWALLNALLIAGTVLALAWDGDLGTRDLLSDATLVTLGVLNLVAFVLDLVLLDVYRILD